MKFLKNLFLPEKIGSYRLFSKYIVGLDINKHVIYATYLSLYANTIAIKSFLEEPIEAGTQENYAQRVSGAILAILSRIAYYDVIHTSISSSSVIIKTLVLPFTSYEKIKMVIDYEMEPSLPFSLQDAVVDFIINHVDHVNNTAEVLAVAVQKTVINEHMQLFEHAAKSPACITVDMIALYNIYLHIPSYKAAQNSVALIDMRSNSTRIIYIKNNQLKLLRSIPDGIVNITKEISTKLDMTPKDAMTQMLRFGHENNTDQEFNQIYSQSFVHYWNKILFTLNSLSVQNKYHAIDKMILLGEGAAIKDSASFAQQTLGIECELFKINELTYNENIKIENNEKISLSYLVSLGTALPGATTELFNLKIQTSDQTQKTIVRNQFFVMVGLTLVMLLGIGAYTLYNSLQLSGKVDTAALKSIKTLNAAFDGKLKKNAKQNRVKQLESMVTEAKNLIKEKEKMWFAFAGPARATFLYNLYELFTLLDKDSLGLTISQLIIKDNVLSLKGEVRDIPALALLNQRLRESKIFRHIIRGGTLQEEKFDIDIQLNVSDSE